MFAQFIKLRASNLYAYSSHSHPCFSGNANITSFRGTSANRALLVPAARSMAAAQAGLHDSGQRLVVQTTQAQAAWRTLLPSAHLRFRAQWRSSARLRARAVAPGTGRQVFGNGSQIGHRQQRVFGVAHNMNYKAELMIVALVSSIQVSA
jgi:hypothetical protein